MTRVHIPPNAQGNRAVLEGKLIEHDNALDALEAAGPGEVPTTRTLTAGTGLSGGGDLSADRAFAIANTAVTPASYTSANITVDQQGRITAAASGGTADVQTTLTLTAGTGLSGGGDLTTNRTFAIANTAVTPASYVAANVTVDQQGRITAASNALTGTATLSGGTKSVATTITAGSKIMVTRNTPGGTLGNLSVDAGTRVVGAPGSFVINSDSGAETSTVDWVVIG